ncbi:MAG TPA: hypothetical protein VMR62_13000 [Bryobacteraceae bacterium]|nr:hypothetical protein [Bryobacteraceae bacterium]
MPAADPVDTIIPTLGQVNAGPADATHWLAVVHPVALLQVYTAPALVTHCW